MTSRLTGSLRFALPLRHRDFRLLWIGQTASNLGNWVYLVAMPFQILALGGSALEIGTAFAVTTAVRVVFLLVGGAIVDRAPRRTVILLSDLGCGVVVTGLAVLGFTGNLRMEHIYVGSAFFGLASSFFTPAMRSVMPELIPAEILVQANALQSLSRQIARLTGPVIGGVVVTAAGPPAGFLIDGLTYLVSFVMFVGSRRISPISMPRENILNEIRSGFDYVRRVTWIWVTISTFTVINAAIFGPLLIGLPVLVRDVLLGDAGLFGLLSAAAGAGEIAGALLAGQGRVAANGGAIYALIFVAGAGVLAFGLAPVFPLILAFAAVVGFALVITNALWDALLQRNVPGHLLGRVTSIDDLGSILLAPVAPIVIGLFIAAHGVVPVFVVGGLSTMVLASLALAVPSIRRVR